MKKIYFILFLVVLSIPVLNAQDENVKVPKNAKLISQSCTTVDLFISLIDMDNNELVIVIYGIDREGMSLPEYNYKRVQVIRTGIRIDPAIQGYVKGGDAATKKQEG